MVVRRYCGQGHGRRRIRVDQAAGYGFFWWVSSREGVCERVLMVIRISSLQLSVAGMCIGCLVKRVSFGLLCHGAHVCGVGSIYLASIDVIRHGLCVPQGGGFFPDNFEDVTEMITQSRFKTGSVRL